MSNNSNNTFPPGIKHIAIIAPAGPATPEKVYAGVKILQDSGIQVTVMPHVFSGSEAKYLAAAATERVADLHNCWKDLTVDLVLCTRGGFGSAHLLPLIDWDLLRSRRLPLIGYSDITVLHLAMLKMNAGISVVAPMAAKLEEALLLHPLKDYTAKYLHKMLTGESVELITPDGKPLRCFRPGTATGMPVAANLAVMSAAIGTPYFPSLIDRILIVEDINEPVYKLDRYFTQLRQAGILNECSAIIFGEFIDCGEKDELNHFFEQISATVNVPVWGGFPFGHGLPLASLRMDKPMAITGDGKIILNHAG
jgi:muramoyltetrapeptide carboxypeptidase